MNDENCQPGRPTVFVGSSGEGLEVARAVQFQLRDVALASVWNEGVFGLMAGTLDSLVVRWIASTSLFS
jgi:predicted nucleotide-binding protein